MMENSFHSDRGICAWCSVPFDEDDATINVKGYEYHMVKCYREAVEQAIQARKNEQVERHNDESDFGD